MVESPGREVRVNPIPASASDAPHGARYRSIRRTTLGLAAPLSAEDCALQSMPDASPVKWHLAHTTWFFETFLLERRSHYRPFDPAYRVLFNSYYNAVGDRHPRAERGMLSRPALDRVLAYRDHVDRAVLALLSAEDFSAEILELGLQHEQQHQELILTDLKHLLSRNPLKPAYQRQWPLTPIRAREPHWIAHAGGLCEIGHAGPSSGCRRAGSSRAAGGPGANTLRTWGFASPPAPSANTTASS